MRKKADGTAFEKEFQEVISKDCYVKRLRTPNSGYAGVREPADYIVVDNRFNYVELKETTGDAFSISGMEQFDLMQEFIHQKQEKYSNVFAGMNYWLVVHFLKRRLIKVVRGEQALDLAAGRKTLRYDTIEGMTFLNLEEMKERHIF